jgi:hypothetical protein
MGLGEFIEKQELIDIFINLVNDIELRRDMHEKMKAIDLRFGFENMVAVVEEEYRKFEFKKNIDNHVGLQ